MTNLGINQPVERREDARLLTGRGRFIADAQPSGTVHGVVVEALAGPGYIVAGKARPLGLFLDLSFAFRLTFLNKCDEIERSLIAEYFQRCFGDDLPEAAAKERSH